MCRSGIISVGSLLYLSIKGCSKFGVEIMTITNQPPDMFQIGETAISWRSKKQTCVALSTAEAEYMALASAAQEAMWLRQIMKKGPKQATVLFEDNQSAIRSKHIGIKYHYIRDQVKDGHIELKYWQTDEMIADMLTKNQDRFEKLRRMPEFEI